MHISKFFAEDIYLKDIHQRVDVLQGCLYISKASIEWDALGQKYLEFFYYLSGFNRFVGYTAFILESYLIQQQKKWVKCNIDGSTKGYLHLVEVFTAIRMSIK